MATTWEIRGRELVNCNCAYGCPCQFNARLRTVIAELSSATKSIVVITEMSVWMVFAPL